MEKKELYTLGDYKVDLIKMLGKGTFGVVYKGYHKKNDTLVAVKKVEIKSDKHGYEGMKEIKNFQHLGKHPHIVQLLDFNYMHNSFWMMMEFCDAGDLQDYFQNNKPDFDLILDMMYQCVSAINYMHSMPAPIVHRDIKPANILMKKSDDGELVIKVTDFGISKVADEQDQAMTMLFSTVAGTPGFMAPEFFANEKYTKSVDVFALGLVFLAMIRYGATGRRELLPITENALKTGHILPVGDSMFNAHIEDRTMPVIVDMKPEDDHKLKVVKELIIAMTPYDGKKRKRLNEVESVLAELLGKTITAIPKPKEKQTDQTNDQKRTGKSSTGTAEYADGELIAISSSDGDPDDIAVRLLKQALEENLNEKLRQLEREGFSKEDAIAKIRDMGFIDQLANLISDTIDIGDCVLVYSDIIRFKKLQQKVTTWSESMRKYLGKTGEVKEKLLQVFKVQFEDGQVFPFNSDLLTKVSGPPDVTRITRDVDEIAIGGGWRGQSHLMRGDVVIVPEDESLIMCLNEGAGGWDPKMSMCLGVKGIVNKVNPNGSIMVECVNGEDWNFNEELLVKVDMSREGIEAGDFVIIENDMQTLQRLQQNHGGWAPDMTDVAGRPGIVKELFSNNRARVEVRGGKWIFNRNALQIVAKGEEMLKAILKKKELKDFS